MSITINMKNDCSFLFSNSMNSSGSGSLGNLNFLSDYKSIKNGSYGKMLKAYYAKTSDQSAAETDKKKPAAALPNEQTKVYTAIDSTADQLKEAADKLLVKGKDSLFHEKDVTVKNEDGSSSVVKQYDKDAIYKAVSSFVKDYNSLITAVGKSDNMNILKTASHLPAITSLYSKGLEKIGITIGQDDKLTLDETKLKSADISAVKSVFNDSPSFAYSASSQASFIDYTASREASKASTYNGTGMYNKNYSMGNLFNSMF